MEPLYKTILNDLKEQISNGTLPLGSQVPTEKELSDTYGVSRITSKRALTELEQLGLIERTRGKGSFVKEPSPQKNSTKRILFLLPFSNDLSLGNFSEGLLPVVQEEQFEVMMTNFDFLTSHQASDIAQEFDGMIYYADDESQHLDLLFDLSFQQFPIVVLDKQLHDLGLPTVLSDNLAGGKAACDYLIEQGHTQIAYIFGHLHPPQSTRQRYLGYIRSLKEQQLTFHTTLEEKLANPANVLEYVEKNGITALVCENDLVAIEAMRVLKQGGYQLPQQISVIGFDDIQAASLVDPALTTISQNFKEIGALAGQSLIAWIKTGQQPDSRKVDVTLITRNSTKEYATND
ncbi:GntR family transcriptional regulator [Candidatus Enterococcus ferrettii]|uniref:HTH gntR-type domain-containing protein n=1 Tax=Candidatus Enterococcus ferrettii TaxID=2815324 RepID=A0ABV0ETV5_9ENTE|nr:LacI family DNA-binding transcriptional regulator [Enterococcus sp. 665A]MBO1341770.1 LacI family DNA-binding transcriptional regulator [Enterococcus sp. 665A]